MTGFQKAVKYGAIVLAAILTFSILGGIMRTLAVVGFLTDSDPATDEMTAYAVSQNVSELKMELRGVDLMIRQGDTLSVESNLKKLTVEEKDGKLTIREQGTIGANYGCASLVITLPTDICLHKVDMELGAGRVTVAYLRAEKLSLKLGAGDVNFDRLDGTDSAKIECGMGNLTIQNGILNDLELDLGMGNTQLTARVTGKSSCSCGIGKLSLTLLGGQDEYRVKLNKGIGSIRWNGKELSTSETIGNGENYLSVQGGMGRIDLSFVP